MKTETDTPFIVPRNDLIPADLNLPMNQYAEDDKAFGDVITSATYLPRVQLIGGNSGLAKEGKVGLGAFALIKSKDTFDDLGKVFDALPLGWRFRAMRITMDGNVLSYFNPKSDEFKKVQTDSELPDSGCMFGVEFLLWLPNVKSWGTYFLSSKTARRQAPALKALFSERRAATIKSEIIKKGKFTWHGPVVVPCSTPLSSIPDSAEIMDEAQKFATPRESVIEKATPETVSQREQ